MLKIPVQKTHNLKCSVFGDASITASFFPNNLRSQFVTSKAGLHVWLTVPRNPSTEAGPQSPLSWLTSPKWPRRLKDRGSSKSVKACIHTPSPNPFDKAQDRLSPFKGERNCGSSDSLPSSVYKGRGKFGGPQFGRCLSSRFQNKGNTALSWRSGVSMALLSLSALIQREKEVPNHHQKRWEFVELTRGYV
jgi:hypothetical protein